MQKKAYRYQNPNYALSLKNIGEFTPALHEDCATRKPMRAHNNVDLIQHNGRYYMAYRTAPFHYASTKAFIYITSSTDGKNWTCENEINMGSDLREPRFLSFQGKLFLYFFQGGKSMFRFQPRAVYVSEYQNGQWTAPQSIGLDGYVPWRLRVQNDSTAILSAYYGVGLYDGGNQNEVRLFSSKDGYAWQPISVAPQVKFDGAEEGEFIFDKEGNLWATVRLEYDGAMIAYADKTDISKWNTVHTRQKYDSALMFMHKDEIFVVARRNVDGEYAKYPFWLPAKYRHRYNQIRYWWTTKRTAIYRLDKENMELVHILDIPGKGDTAFPGITQLDSERYLLVNYSNDPTGPDYPWIIGQIRDTYLYAIEIEIK